MKKKNNNNMKLVSRNLLSLFYMYNGHQKEPPFIKPVSDQRW